MVLKKDIKKLEMKIKEVEENCNLELIEKLIIKECKQIENTLKMRMELEKTNLKLNFEDFTIKELREKGYKVKIEL